MDRRYWGQSLLRAAMGVVRDQVTSDVVFRAQSRHPCRPPLLVEPSHIFPTIVVWNPSALYARRYVEQFSGHICLDRYLICPILMLSSTIGGDRMGCHMLRNMLDESFFPDVCKSSTAFGSSGYNEIEFWLVERAEKGAQMNICPRFLTCRCNNIRGVCRNIGEVCCFYEY